MSQNSKTQAEPPWKELEERDEVEHFVGVHQEHDVNRSGGLESGTDYD